MIFESPRLVKFPEIGSPSIGFISICENFNHTPFEIKRVFWTYATPPANIRGHHAHYKTEMILIAVSGRIIVHTEMPDGDVKAFTLEHPDTGLYLPTYCWHTMEYEDGAIQLVLANNLHDANDYIRSIDDFRELGKKQ